MACAPLSIHLNYRFDTPPQTGDEVVNPLLQILAGVQQHGSIQHAARAMGMSYRYTWGQLKDWEAALGEPLLVWAQGKKARLTPFAMRWLWAERQARVRAMPHLEALRAELRHALAQACDPTLELLEVLASHDLALPHLQALAAPRGLHLDLRFADSTQALRSLHEARVQVAGFHVPRLPPQGSKVFARALRPLLNPGEHKLIGSHWRRQGLILAAGHAAPSDLAALADDLRAHRRRIVNRQPGSGTRILLEHLLHEAGVPIDSLPGFEDRIEPTHLAVAAAIAAGTADVGLGLEAAAHAFGLPFVPLAIEDYFLVCLKPQLDTAPVQALRTLLATRAWTHAVQALPGYGAERPGEVLSLTRALPWWRFAGPKAVPKAGAGRPA